MRFHTLHTNTSYHNIDANASNSSIQLNLPKLLFEFDVSESIGLCSSRNNYKESIKSEVDKYFGIKRSSNIKEGLRDFPNIFRVFLKFNCIRSSEAIYERMFSYAGKKHFFLYCAVHFSLLCCPHFFYIKYPF